MAPTSTIVALGFQVAVVFIFVAFILMFSGYGILIWQALHSAEKGAAFKAIWSIKDYRLLHPLAGRLIYSGALFGALGFLSMLLVMPLLMRR